MAFRSDAELARDWASGDHSAFAQVYEKYSNALFGVAVGLVGNRASAADVVHDTFVRAAQRISTLRDAERLRAWLFAILRNEAVDVLRSSGRERPEDVAAMSDQVAADLPEPHLEVSRAELSAVVWTAADGLQQRDREVLELHVRAGLEAGDLADALGVTPGHAAVLLSRMRDRMERAIGALLVARLGRRECTTLDALLTDWDGRFTLSVRSQVTRHVEACSTCNRGRLELASYYRLAPALLPVFVVPAELRERVLSSLQLTSFDGTVSPGQAGSPGQLPGPGTSGPWSWRDDGFPHPLPEHAPVGVSGGEPADAEAGTGAAIGSGAGTAVLGASLLGAAGTQPGAAGPEGAAAAGIAEPPPPPWPSPAPAVPDMALLPGAPVDAPPPAATSGGPGRPGSGTLLVAGALLVALLGAVGIWKTFGPSAPASDASPSVSLPVTPATTAPEAAVPVQVTTAPPTTGPTSPTATSASPSPSTASESATTTSATSAAAGHLTATPARLALRPATTADPTTTAQLTLGNDGGQAVSWAATVTGTGLSISPASGSAAAGAATRLTVTLNGANLPEGGISGQVTITVPTTGRTITVPVTSSVEHPPVVTAGPETTKLVVRQKSTGCRLPTATSVKAQATDEGGKGTIALVVLIWNDGRSDHKTTMSQDGAYYGSVGPYATAGTHPVTVQATDARGNVGSTSFSMYVSTC